MVLLLVVGLNLVAVRVVQFGLQIWPKWELFTLPSREKLTFSSCTVNPPSSVARRPLRSYIPPHAYILELGKDIDHLIRISLWQGKSELCLLLQLFEDFERGGKQQRENIMSHWHERWWPFRNNSVIGEILRDLNTTSANTTESPVAPIHVVLVVEIYYQEVFDSYISGTGNWVWALYAMRLWALTASRSGSIQVDFLFDCHDAADRQSEWVAPWLTGYFSSAWIYEIVAEDDCHDKSVTQNIRNQSETIASQFEELRQIGHQVKSFWDMCPDEQTSIPVMLPFIRHELRRMAVALVGMPEKLRSGWGTQHALRSVPRIHRKPSSDH
jgi:hypothetical protein